MRLPEKHELTGPGLDDAEPRLSLSADRYGEHGLKQ